MRFSTRTTYGLRAMINLAKNSKDRNVSLASIASGEQISQKYLERLFVKLKKAGLVESVKGVKGGYRLSKKPEEIKVYDIVKTLEGKMSPFHCLDEKGRIYCNAKCRCGATSVLIRVQQAVNKTLKTTKLSDII